MHPIESTFYWVRPRECRQPAATKVLPRGVLERCLRRGLVLSIQCQRGKDHAGRRLPGAAHGASAARIEQLLASIRLR